MKKNFAILLLITGIATALRLVWINEVPSILNRDEAALAYNAYLLKHSGMDEWGRGWPLALESFGDYKLIGYPAILVFFFNFLPINDLTVVLPSIIAGSLLPLLVYLLSRNFSLNPNLSIFAALLVAINPVFIFYSRMAFEANVALSLLVAAIVLFTQDMHQKIKVRTTKSIVIDLFGIILITAATLTYNTPLLLIPMVMFIVLLKRGIRNVARWLIPVIGLSFVFIIMLSQLSTLMSQKSSITIFTDPTVWHEYTEYRSNIETKLGQRIWGNKYVYYGKTITSNFIQSFTPQFLVTRGGTHPWHSIPNWGHILWPTYILGLVGILFIAISSFKTKRLNSAKVLLLFTLVMSLAPAVITVDAPHATRSLLFFVMFCIATIHGLGLVNRYSKVMAGLLVAINIIWSGFYVSNYLIQYRDTHQKILQAGFDSLVLELDHYQDEIIYIVDPGGYQYILLSWYLKMPPQEFYNTVVRLEPDQIGFSYGQKVGNYHFIANRKDGAEGAKFVEWRDDKWVIGELRL